MTDISAHYLHRKRCPWEMPIPMKHITSRVIPDSLRNSPIEDRDRYVSVIENFSWWWTNSSSNCKGLQHAFENPNINILFRLQQARKEWLSVRNWMSAFEDQIQDKTAFKSSAVPPDNELNITALRLQKGLLNPMNCLEFSHASCKWRTVSTINISKFQIWHWFKMTRSSAPWSMPNTITS